jgi:type I restriction enzyme, R subunit
MQRRVRDNSIHQHALRLFERLGYTIIDGSQEEEGSCIATGRRSASDVVLWQRLRNSLQRLNPDCSEELIDKAMQALTEDRGLSSLVHANRDIYVMLKDGVKLDARGQLVTENDENTTLEKAERREHVTLRIIDWREPDTDNNDFTLVSRFWVNGRLGKRCLDLVAFVNGLPLVLLEIVDGELSAIFDRIDQDYKATIPPFFWYNAFLAVADTFTCKMGSLSSPWGDFVHWKRVRDEREGESTRLDTLIEGTCDRVRLLDIVENFTLFDESKGLHKLIARNHQYLGVNNAIATLQDIRRKPPAPEERHRKLGVFWHTQGSGKSYSMIFFARKVLRTISNDYTFLVVTDRKDLDKQIYDNFLHTGSIIGNAKDVHARDGKHLKRLLRGQYQLIFTLIQKFRIEQNGRNYEELSDRENIIVMADEAHRTEYDVLARNLRDALPRATFIGFTGTPLIKGEEEETRATFGNYVSIYNFRRAINDGVTVPLYYENHTPELELVNKNFNEEMAEKLQKARTPEQQQRIIEQYTRSEQFLTKGQRLDLVAEDIVEHFMRRGFLGKAMVVCLNRITAVRMYNRVREQWERYQKQLNEELQRERDPQLKADLSNKIAYMKQTEMAVIVSADEDDAKHSAEMSEQTGEHIDLTFHYQRLQCRNLAEDFKNANHPLRIAFVCAMWMTGFDVPCLSTMYLDNPLKDHTLMQTIARVNRVFKDKVDGLIIDYSGAIHNLADALATYAQEYPGAYDEQDSPVGEKSELVQALRDKLKECEEFCQGRGIDVPALLERLEEAGRQKQRELVLSAVNALLVYDEIKVSYLVLAGEIRNLYKGILPDAAEKEFTLPVHLHHLVESRIYDTMRRPIAPDLMQDIRDLVHRSLEVRERLDRLSADTYEVPGSFYLHQVDLSRLDSSLRSGHRHIAAEQLRNQILDRIQRMMQVNPSRVTYMEKLQRAIDRYNEGCENQAIYPDLVDSTRNISQHPATILDQERLLDEYDDALMEVARDVAEEEQRHTREGLSEQELAIFDILTLNVSLTGEERARVKQVARDVLAALRPTFDLIDWQKKALTLNRARVTIEDELFKLSQAYNPETYNQECDALFLHVQQHNKNDGSTSVA